MADVPLDDRRPALVASRGGGFDPLARKWVSWLCFAGAIVLWQAASEAGLVDPLFLPSPLAIARSLGDLAMSGELARHFGASLMRIGAGWVIGAAPRAVVGSPVGLFGVGRSRRPAFLSGPFPL